MAGPKISPIVGMGSSAGGIEALEAVFRAMPPQINMAFVVIAHLAPTRETALPSILSRFTSMPVLLAEHDQLVELDHVYVAPPNTTVSIRKRKLELHENTASQSNLHPIDSFLGSLAEDQGEQSIAVILSGSGSDGMLGVKAIKERGGFTIVQGSGRFPPRHLGMPSSAIGTGLVDLVLPAEAIPGKLVEYVQSFETLSELTAEGNRRTSRSLDSATIRESICGILRDRLAHDFSGYKDRTFMRRVQRRMQVLQIDSANSYVEHLRKDPTEVSLLFADLLISVTHFFRDKDAFEALEKNVIPRLFDGKGAGDTLRIWVPGCATGEEVYSIAILIREYMATLPVSPRIQLFATDIDEPALQVARTGRYPATLLDGMAQSRLERFFTRDGETYTVSKQIRDMCVFSSHSLIRDPPYSRLDLVSCRNLLIYLSSEMQSRIIPVFHYALRPGGFLFLGTAENVSQHADLFAQIDKKARIFRRRDQVSATAHFPLFVHGMRFGSPEAARPLPNVQGSTLRRMVESELLEHFAPAHVVVNREGDTIFHSARTGKYLELPAGQPSRQILAMARKGLRLDLRSALQEALESHRPVERERIGIELEDGTIQLINLAVSPLPEQDSGLLFLILFTDLGAPVRPTDMHGHWRIGSDAPAEQLELELRDTRERLQSTIEEYETGLEELKSANEELVSVNEELQSTNEELETSKEEIQSMNEELHTVNQELNAKIDLLNQSNNDLRNLFESTRIAIVFLDRQLVIRNFTPAVTKLFSLLPTDRGRPLADITSHLDHPSLHDDIRTVVNTGQSLETRVATRDGTAHFMMRVLPYRDDDRLDGVIITFFELTDIVAAERQQLLLVQELNHRVRNMLAVVTVIARQTVARQSSPAEFEEAFIGRIEALARAYGLVAKEQWGDVQLLDIIDAELEPHMMENEARFRIRGPSVMVRPKAALALGLVLHELATNAIKYGALSVAEGSLSVEWVIEPSVNGRWLSLSWSETGGPPVREPTSQGFGSLMIEREIRHELSGEIATEYREKGLHVAIRVPWRQELLG